MLNFCKNLASSVMVYSLVAAGSATAENKAQQATPDQVTESLAQEHKISNVYVHKWVKIPTFTAKYLWKDEELTVTPRYGEATVVIFLASWCLPCQRLVGVFKDLEKKYENRYTNFYYVFSHDTESDARGFVKEHGLHGTALVGNAETLTTYHEPQLPSVYVADRFNWMAMRLLNTNREGLKELDHFLKLHTSY